MYALTLALAAAAAGGARAAVDSPVTVADEPPTWDRPASIRGAAERLGILHRAKGATAAYQLIDNCYRTHILAESYGEGFEICIAQDYLETQVLVQVYSRMPPESLQKMGVPSPAELAESMGRRVASAFQHYQKPQAFADELKKLVDQHGMPVFLAIVFPEAVKAMQGKNPEEKKLPQ
jgi:hypothetical protein